MDVTELLKASEDGNLSRVRRLIAAGADVNKTIRGDSPIYIAVARRHVDIVKELIKAGANVNVQNEDGVTPLNQLSSYNDVFQPNPSREIIQLEIIKLLLEAGADIHIANNRGRTPIINAASYSYYERLATVKLLIEAGANVNDVAKSGFTALMGAAFQGHVNIVKALLEAGADIDRVLKERESPFGEVGDTAITITETYGRRNRKRILEMLDRSRRRRVVNARWAGRLVSGNGPIPANIAPLLQSYLVDPSEIRPTNVNYFGNKKITWGKNGGRQTAKRRKGRRATTRRDRR